MANVQISLQEVSDAANRIYSLNQSMYESLKNIQQEMNRLDGSWISDGSSEIRNRFNLFAKRFDEQHAVIESYAKFLEFTVSSYDTLESTITSNAAGMQA